MKRCKLAISGSRLVQICGEKEWEITSERLWKGLPGGDFDFEVDLNQQGIAEIRAEYVSSVNKLSLTFLVEGEYDQIQLPQDYIPGQDHLILGGELIPLRRNQVSAVSQIFSELDVNDLRDLSPKSFFGTFEVLRDNRMETVLPEDLSALLQKPRAVELPHLKGTPLPYQSIGINWMCDYFESGLGSLLADEMGLGKTFQALGLISHAINHAPNKTVLVVCPNTLVSNWLIEFEKFLPSPAIYVHRGTNRVGNLQSKSSVPVWITTYNILARDSYQLSLIDFSLVVFDEAQALKNQTTATRIAAKQLKANCKTLVTGTPFENSLSDIWSLFDLVHDGLLGSWTDFQSSIQDLPSHAQALSSVIRPLILRRRVSDVDLDLPPIVEFDVPLQLSSVLGEEYEKRRSVGQNQSPQEGFLSLSNALRQICASSMDIAENEKYIRLFDILLELHAIDEDKVLIFSNWRQSIEDLRAHIVRAFGEERVDVLHGDVLLENRQPLVDSFNARSGFAVLVVNPTVGGVGLNIPGASHVVHFDRLWNPMLEVQATRRAWRPGQKKKVFVHKFFYQGTIEDIIQQRLKLKRGLADDVLSQALSLEEETMKAKARLVQPMQFSS